MHLENCKLWAEYAFLTDRTYMVSAYKNNIPIATIISESHAIRVLFLKKVIPSGELIKTKEVVFAKGIFKTADKKPAFLPFRRSALFIQKIYDFSFQGDTKIVKELYFKFNDESNYHGEVLQRKSEYYNNPVKSTVDSTKKATFDLVNNWISIPNHYIDFCKYIDNAFIKTSQRTNLSTDSEVDYFFEDGENFSIDTNNNLYYG